jgi:hypothetical protein
LPAREKGRDKRKRARPDHLARPPPNNNAHTLTAHADEAFAQHPIMMMGHSLARQPRPNPPQNRAAHAPERGTPSVAGGHRTGCIAHWGSRNKVPRPFLWPSSLHKISRFPPFSLAGKSTRDRPCGTERRAKSGTEAEVARVFRGAGPRATGTRLRDWFAWRAGGMGGAQALNSSAGAEAVSEAAAERSALRWLRCSAVCSRA